VVYLGMVVLGLAAGVVAGLMGIGGGVILVPAMVYLLSMAQHLAQGRSVFFALSHFRQPIMNSREYSLTANYLCCRYRDHRFTLV
jgi:hypothetical protein